MPRVYYGTRSEPSFELKPSPDLIAVRTHSRQSVLERGTVLMPAAQELDDGELVAEFPDAGVEVYRIDASKRSVTDRKLALRKSDDVRFAGEVLVQPATGKPVLYTENVYVRFQPGLDPDDCEKILRDAGLIVRQSPDFANNAFFATAPEGTGQQVFEIAEKLLQRPEVIYCHPELIQPRVAKQIFPQQWHLKSTTINGKAVNAHVNLEEAHLVSQGERITIAIIDDGVDIDHPEFASAGKIVAPRDVTLSVDDPRPKSSREKHGSACAGVACADGIDGASGVAPKSRLMPIRLASGLGSFQEAEAFRYAADQGADVISCSWGPADGTWFDPNDAQHNHVEPLPASTRDALLYATTQGRGGKGCVVLFAAGNGRESVDNDGYASSPMVIAVAACNDTSHRSVYTDFGKAVWCCFPSSDFGHAPFGHPDALTPGIWTTDRVGVKGYNTGSVAAGDASGNYTNSFGGTSSSCPGAAGVAALILATNPNLTLADVRTIMRSACVKIDTESGEYTNDHSPYYGYGRLDAAAAVKQAQANRSRLAIYRKLVNAPIPDLGTISETLDVGDDPKIEGFVVAIRLKHTYIGDLKITLVPPSGAGLASVVLHDRSGGRKKEIDRQYSVADTPALAAYLGKSCKGSWTFRVEDKAAQDSGTLQQIELQLTLPQTPDENAQPTVASRGHSAHSARNGSIPRTVKKRATPKKVKAKR